MYKIKYYNNEPSEFDEQGNPIENIVSLEYPVYSEEDKNKWYDIIQKSYGQYGEVAIIEVPDDRKPTLEDIVNQLLTDNLKSKGAILE